VSEAIRRRAKENARLIDFVGGAASNGGTVDRPSWAAVNPNHYAIGIEPEGQAGDLWTRAILATDAEFIAGIATR
jgi:hypothetical protein